MEKWFLDSYVLFQQIFFPQNFEHKKRKKKRFHINLNSLKKYFSKFWSNILNYMFIAY